MDNYSGEASRSDRNTNTSRRPQPRQQGESSTSGRIALPSHPAGRSSQSPSYLSPGRQPTTLDSFSEQSPSRPASYQSPASPFEDAMSRSAGPGPTTVSTTRPQQYQLVSPGTPADPRSMSQNNKDQLVQSLRTHRVNTITELRRIEKIFAFLDSAEVTEPMTTAWAHYVNSNNLLNELRGLTRTYPFSSECLDEAKAMVVRDPSSTRSWNYCWLVLVKMEKENLIMKHARALASKASTWGGRRPTKEEFDRLVNACVAEWTRALRQMLKHWDKPPSTTGN